MAQAVPVVAIAELGTRSILVEGEGASIAPCDEHIFADKAYELLDDADLRQRLGAAGRRYVSTHWTAKAQAERMLDFYRQVLAVGETAQVAEGVVVS